LKKTDVSEVRTVSIIRVIYIYIYIYIYAVNVAVTVLFAGRRGGGTNSNVSEIVQVRKDFSLRLGPNLSSTNILYP
jgi:hypothetical protein